MSAKDEWILFLESHPEFNKISSSSICLSMLRMMKASSLDTDSLYAGFAEMDRKDADDLIGLLLDLKLLHRVTHGHNVFFCLTPLARELLKAYSNARKGFKIE